MECEDVDADLVTANVSTESGLALNSTILEYYKKFGRKRDLEQYFSLSTAQADVRDPSSLFWRRMKAQNESSDSGDKSRDSSMEVCRISIKCSLPEDVGSSQDEDPKTKTDSVSPPIITEDVAICSVRHSDDESIKSDDNHSPKSILDTSTNKALSPTSSITSQRKLEWDSLADVGYANEGDKMTCASNLSTLERLALQQQYSNNDTKQDNIMGIPTAHSTPVEENETKSKKKGSKTTKIYRKDVDFVEVNMPHTSDANPSQSINVNLTKHISFNVERDGGVFIKNETKDMSVTPKIVEVETERPQGKTDKEIQTSLLKQKDCLVQTVSPDHKHGQDIPLVINMNALKKKNKRKKVKSVKKRLVIRKKVSDSAKLPVYEKSGEQVSEAESFEYMPGHIYNQNQINTKPSKNPVDNKSSLESSGAVTTDSSKDSKHSFSKDLEKSIKLLRTTLRKRYDDVDLKQKLIKDVVQRLLQSSYRDDDTTTAFLSGMSFSSRQLGMSGGNTTTSTSDMNNTAGKSKVPRPKKSILRNDKFNVNTITVTTQSAPNFPSVSYIDKPVYSKLIKTISSNTNSDVSSRDKTSSETGFPRTYSEELYQKYLNALKREESYKKHLKDKEIFLKQKLASSDTAVNIPLRLDSNSESKLKELMKDLTRNNYDDGSGDASKLEGCPNSSPDFRLVASRNLRSPTVFTLSAGNSDNRKGFLLKGEQKDNAKAGHSKEVNHYCCCPHHNTYKLGVSDSSIQVNIKSDNKSNGQKYEKCCACTLSGQDTKTNTGSPRAITRIVSDDKGDIKYVCLCETDNAETCEVNDNLLIYRCSRMTNKCVQAQGASKSALETPKQNSCLTSQSVCAISNLESKISKCSQTNLLPCRAEQTVETKGKICIHEAIRCIQTDISIDPKIADPSLSDITIVKHCDCVKLIREQYRQVSKSEVITQSDENIVQQGNKNAIHIDISDETEKDCCKRKQDKNKEAATLRSTSTTDTGIQFDSDPKIVREGHIDDNFTIPIHGTNMTVRVSVGSSVQTQAKEKTTNAVQVDSEEGSDKSDNSNKGGQCPPTQLFKAKEKAPCRIKPKNSQIDDFLKEKPKNAVVSSSKGIVDINRNINSIPAKSFEHFLRSTDQCSNTVHDPCKIAGRTCREQSNSNTTQSLARSSVESPRFKEKSQNIKITGQESPRICSAQNCNRICVGSPRLTEKPNDSNTYPPKHAENLSTKGQVLDDSVLNIRNVKIFQRHIDKCKEEGMVFPRRVGRSISKEKSNQTRSVEVSPHYREKGTSCEKNHCSCTTRHAETSSRQRDRPSNASNTVTKNYEDTSRITEIDEHSRMKERSQNFENVDRPRSSSPRRYGEVSSHLKETCHSLDRSDNLNQYFQNTRPGKSTIKPITEEDNTVRKSTVCKSDQIKSADLSVGVQSCDNGIFARPNPVNTIYAREELICFPNITTVSKTVQKSSKKITNEAVNTDRSVDVQKDLLDEIFSMEPRSTETTCSNEYQESEETNYSTAAQPRSNTYPKIRIRKMRQKNHGDIIKVPSSNSLPEEPSIPTIGTKRQMFDKSESSKDYILGERGEVCTKSPCPSNVYCGTYCPKGSECKEADEYENEFHQSPNPSSNLVDVESNNCAMYSEGLKINDSSKPELGSKPETKRKNICKKVEFPPAKRKDEFLRDKINEINFSQLRRRSIDSKCETVGLQKETQAKEVKKVAPADCDRGKTKIDILCSQPSLQKSSCSTQSKCEGTSPKTSECIKPKEVDKPAKCKEGLSKDVIMNVIQDITNRYSKQDIERSQRKKCFKEIISILSYLLDTEDSTDGDTAKKIKEAIAESSGSDFSIIRQCKEREILAECERNRPDPSTSSQSTNEKMSVVEKICCKLIKNVGSGSTECENCSKKQKSESQNEKKLVDKGVQLCPKKSKPLKCFSESSDMPISTDLPSTSSDSATCKVLNKIKKECEKYHQNRCKTRHKRCECSSTTSISCSDCKRVHHCLCRAQKCKGHKPKNLCEKLRKKCVAYNLIIQNSDSIISEDPPFAKTYRPLKNIIVKVPSKRNCHNMGIKIERPLPYSSPRSEKGQRSQSLPKECNIPNADDSEKTALFTVRDYLESNRPDFVKQCTQRQNCLKLINETRANERAIKRELLSMQLQLGESALDGFSEADLRMLAQDFGFNIRQKRVPSKFISERDMKKHSRKIYKTLPEVVQKKEDAKKENIKKTNLLMASIFKKNLQKKVLQGNVDLSNYSSVIKI